MLESYDLNLDVACVDSEVPERARGTQEASNKIPGLRTQLALRQVKSAKGTHIVTVTLLRYDVLQQTIIKV